MSKVNSLISQRFKKAGDALSKMKTLGERSSSGNLSSFSGLFKVGKLSVVETQTLKELLQNYREEETDVDADLFSLSTLTAEVKAINNQAILLHGERIRRAQELLKNYREGAFSNWLVNTYGNRQTPYNFLQYYELHAALKEDLREKLDEMPRQAVYSLASRDGDIAKKIQIIKRYHNEPKEALLQLIRQTFPLASRDKRAQDLCDLTLGSLKRLNQQIDTSSFSPTPSQKKQLLSALQSLKKQIETR